MPLPIASYSRHPLTGRNPYPFRSAERRDSRRAQDGPRQLSSDGHLPYFGPLPPLDLALLRAGRRRQADAHAPAQPRTVRAQSGAGESREWVRRQCGRVGESDLPQVRGRVSWGLAQSTGGTAGAHVPPPFRRFPDLTVYLWRGRSLRKNCWRSSRPIRTRPGPTPPRPLSSPPSHSRLARPSYWLTWTQGVTRRV